MLTLDQYNSFTVFTVDFAKFQQMCEIDVSQWTKKDKNRGGLDYLNWAAARKLLKQHFPNLVPRVIVTDEYQIYHDVTPMVDEDGNIHRGTLVMACLYDTSNGSVSEIMQLPVMATNKMNSAIEVPTSRQISDTLMRCINKLIATVTGIGFGMYMRDDGLLFEGSESAHDDEDDTDIDYTDDDEFDGTGVGDDLTDEDDEFDIDDDDYIDDEEEEEEEPAPKKTTRRFKSKLGRR